MQGRCVKTVLQLRIELNDASVFMRSPIGSLENSVQSLGLRGYFLLQLNTQFGHGDVMFDRVYFTPTLGHLLR